MYSVQAWIDQHEWKAKPIRPISSFAWLCVAEQKIEDQFPHWNSKPVLIKWVQSKGEQEPVVFAGNVQNVFQFASDEVTQGMSTDTLTLPPCNPTHGNLDQKTRVHWPHSRRQCSEKQHFHRFWSSTTSENRVSHRGQVPSAR